MLDGNPGLITPTLSPACWKRSALALTSLSLRDVRKRLQSYKTSPYVLDMRAVQET